MELIIQSFLALIIGIFFIAVGVYSGGFMMVLTSLALYIAFLDGGDYFEKAVMLAKIRTAESLRKIKA